MKFSIHALVRKIFDFRFFISLLLQFSKILGKSSGSFLKKSGRNFVKLWEKFHKILRFKFEYFQCKQIYLIIFRLRRIYTFSE